MIFLSYIGSDYKASNASFLFSLRNPNNMQPFKCPVKDTGYAIYCSSSYGASFGSNYDLCIENNSSTRSDVGHSYQPPPGYEYDTPQTKALFAGTYQFQPTEIEVFY